MCQCARNIAAGAELKDWRQEASSPTAPGTQVNQNYPGGSGRLGLSIPGEPISIHSESIYDRRGQDTSFLLSLVPQFGISQSFNTMCVLTFQLILPTGMSMNSLFIGTSRVETTGVQLCWWATIRPVNVIGDHVVLIQINLRIADALWLIDWSWSSHEKTFAPQDLSLMPFMASTDEAFREFQIYWCLVLSESLVIISKFCLAASYYLTFKNNRLTSTQYRRVS